MCGASTDPCCRRPCRSPREWGFANNAEADKGCVGQPPDTRWELWITLRPRRMLYCTRLRTKRRCFIAERAAARHHAAIISHYPFRGIAEKIEQAELIRL